MTRLAVIALNFTEPPPVDWTVRTSALIENRDSTVGTLNCTRRDRSADQRPMDFALLCGSSVEIVRTLCFLLFQSSLTLDTDFRIKKILWWLIASIKNWFLWYRAIIHISIICFNIKIVYLFIWGFCIVVRVRWINYGDIMLFIASTIFDTLYWLQGEKKILLMHIYCISSGFDDFRPFNAFEFFF